MTQCGCGAIHELNCPVAEMQQQALAGAAAARAWALVSHAPDCPTKSATVAECEWCRPWEPEDGPYWDGLLGWFDKPHGKRFDCSCSVGPAHPPEMHARTCRFQGPVVPLGRGRSYPDMKTEPRREMSDLLERMRQNLGELERLLEKSK